MPPHSRLVCFLLCTVSLVAMVRGQESIERSQDATTHDAAADAISWYDSLGKLRQAFEGTVSGEARVVDPATKEAGLREHAARAAELKDQKAIAVRIGRVRWAALTLRHAVDETLRKQASDALVASLDDPDSRVRVVLHKELFRTPVDGEAARHAFGRVTRWLVDPATSPARIRQLREHLRSRMRAKAADAAQRARRTEQSPKPLRAGDRRLIGNESAAIATLKNVALGQAQVQASGVIDIDGDGKGEFGFFGEMSGALPIRESTLGSTDAAPKRIIPPVLSGAFCAVTDHGSVQRSGYWYRMYLPSESGVPTDEATMLDGTRIDPERAEHSWCAFAWPIERGRSGIGCFAVDVMGAVWRTNDRFGDFDGEWTLDVVANSMLVAPKPDGFCPSGMHWKRIQ